MDKILTVEQVADALQVKAITVREMFRDKRIRGFKVGKAWRTTEKMLQEDIEAIARGDSPADLPMLGTEAPAREVAVPKRGRKNPGVEPATAKAPAKAAAKASTKRAAKAGTNGALEGGAEVALSPAARKAAKTIERPAEDDTQQLLF
jgi:excisionase family DNA binding protein